MARKTYKPGWYHVIRAVQRYGEKNLPFMEQFLTPQQLTCVQAVLAAIAECIPLFLPPPPTP